MTEKKVMEAVQLAEYLHRLYEQASKDYEWKTQVACQVDFAELPLANKKVMIAVATSLIDYFGRQLEQARLEGIERGRKEAEAAIESFMKENGFDIEEFNNGNYKIRCILDECKNKEYLTKQARQEGRLEALKEIEKFERDVGAGRCIIIPKHDFESIKKRVVK